MENNKEEQGDNSMPIRTVKADCHFNRNNTCMALFARCCLKNCHFYQTDEQARASQEKAYARLRTLPAEQQESIADLYYLGKKPWLETPNN